MKFFQPIIDKYHAYKLQKAVAILRDRTKVSKECIAVCRSLETALAATRNMNGAGPVAVMFTRRELAEFVKYVMKLHDMKVGHISQLKYAITAILMKRHLTAADMQAMKAGKSKIILPEGSGNRNKRRLRTKALQKR